MLTKEQLGQKTALTLIGEMRFLGKLTDRRDNNDLIDPSDERPNFQTICGESAAKSELAADFLVNVAALRYCVADGEVERKELFDIDHTHAFSEIQKKQKALLAHLNDPSNADFAKGFLSASEIDQYFGIKNGDREIKGTRRFYKLCYNDIDNLLLLCHACNLKKGAQDSLDWFGKQEPFLGEKFVKTVTEAGGFHDGIIIKKVMKKGEGTPVVLIGGVECTLHNEEKDVYGMGEFVKNWFEEKNPGYRGDILRAYKDVWLSLKDIFKARLLQQDPEKHRQSAREGGKMVSALEQVIETIDSYYGIRRAVHDSPKSQSSSGSDDSAEKGARLDSIDRSVKEVFQQMHDIKVFYKEISKDHAEKVMDKKDVFKLLEAHGFYELEHGLQKTALREIQEEIKKLDPSKALTKEVAEPIIKSGIKKYFFATAQRQVEEAQRQAELEKKARLEKQQRVEELEKQLEEQRKIAEELKREVQARKEGEEARKSSSSQSQFDTFKESREENTDKIKRAKVEDPDARRSPSPFDEKK